MEKILFYFNPEICPKYVDYVKEHIKKTEDEFIFNNGQNLKDDLINIAKQLEDKTIDRAIILDDFGTLPFMILSKFKNIIAAQVLDAFSAKITKRNNNSNALAIACKISAEDNTVDIINSYLSTVFVPKDNIQRVNMLKSLLEDK